MSQENVEAVRDLMRGFNDRDESVISHYAEDADYRLIGGFSDMAGQSIKGREAIRQFAFELIENLGARFEIERLFEANDQVVLIANTVGAGEASGAPVTQRWGQVYTFRDGKVIAVDNYWHANEALEAVGLSE
jgi:ketosteroid isomerase-like protein